MPTTNSIKSGARSRLHPPMDLSYASAPENIVGRAMDGVKGLFYPAVASFRPGCRRDPLPQSPI